MAIAWANRSLQGGSHVAGQSAGNKMGTKDDKGWLTNHRRWADFDEQARFAGEGSERL